jgi:hypothetical protein
MLLYTRVYELISLLLCFCFLLAAFVRDMVPFTTWFVHV